MTRISRNLACAATALCTVAVGVGLAIDPDESPAQPPRTGALDRPDTPAPSSPASPPTKPRATDIGIFSDLDNQITVTLAPWIDPRPTHLVRHGRDTYFMVGATPIGLTSTEASAIIEVADFGADDADGDGIPNVVDLLMGAKKTVANGARYEGSYARLQYPGGDVDRKIGVCTDVVIRAFRNAGLDLQKLLYEDIGSRPSAFPMVKTRNRNIDHRRVKTLLPYFQRHLWARDTDPRADLADWLPGDVVLMDTLRGPEPDHIGIISDTLGDSGLPLVINNWTDGYNTSEMDLLDTVPVTHRFRMPAAGDGVQERDRGLEAVARRSGVVLSAESSQVLLVTTDAWSDPSGELRRFARSAAGWTQVGEPIAVSVGSAGMGRGRGLHDRDVALRIGPEKKEGDRRAPAGLFGLGTSFGPSDGPWRWPFRKTEPEDRVVDDPLSPDYNTWQRAPGRWASAERMADYRLGLVVDHNRGPIEPGAGSAIFLHTGDPTVGTLGCTVMSEPNLRKVLAWLQPDRRPVLLQVPGHLY